jgi:hypothetical protein
MQYMKKSKNIKQDLKSNYYLPLETLKYPLEEIKTYQDLSNNTHDNYLNSKKSVKNVNGNNYDYIYHSIDMDSTRYPVTISLNLKKGIKEYVEPYFNITNSQHSM